MLGRKKMPRKKDKKIFRNTADKSKKMNIKPVIMRGGIRL